MEPKLDSTKRAISKFEKESEKIGSEAARKNLAAFVKKAEAQIRAGAGTPLIRQNMMSDVALLKKLMEL